MKHLTHREIQILALVAEGQTNKAIGGRLGIALQTVKNKAADINRKLGAHNRAHAVVIAMREGFLKEVSNPEITARDSRRQSTGYLGGGGFFGSNSQNSGSTAASTDHLDRGRCKPASGLCRRTGKDGGHKLSRAGRGVVLCSSRAWMEGQLCDDSAESGP